MDDIYNFIKFTLEKKEKVYINENKYDDKYNIKEINEKLLLIKNFFDDFQKERDKEKNIKNYNLSQNDFNKIRKLAISKGGFMTMENRRELYKKILCYNQDILTTKKYYNTIWINKNKLTLYNRNEFLFQFLNHNKDRSVIKVDIERSNINYLFPSELYPEINKKVKENLEKCLNYLISFNKGEFHYYQSYHDILMIFFYLYPNDFYLYTLLYQRFSEFFLKENLILQDKNGNIGYSFNNALKLFTFILSKVNKITLNDINKFANGECTYVLSYIISYFTHNIQNIFLQMRLIDYLIVSHPLSIFVLTSYFIVDEITKLKTKYLTKLTNSKVTNYLSTHDEKENIEELNISDFYVHFQQIEFDKIDFDDYILKVEDFFNSFSFDDLKKEFCEGEMKFEVYYPLMNKEIYLETFIIEEYEKINKKKGDENINIITNNKYYKICSEKYKKISNSLIKKITKSKIYSIGNKFYPLVFITNSIITLPLIYYICFKKR